jgi:hypothetical protein
MDFRFGNTKCKTNEFVFIDACHRENLKNQSKIKIRNFLRNVFEKKDATKFEPTYRNSKRMFDFRKGNRRKFLGNL